MTNDEMKAGRFARWASARKRCAKIIAALEAGNTVVIATHMRATKYDKRHVAMFRATKTGVLVQRGKAWDCIDGCKITAYSK